ncbi:MAG: DNA polymerase III subunit delta' [Candidatus Adiutrix sp.]|jgi:DNA polymerase-3 subunit delta'|nr:DNA polymerase III subunit delta' [Candidatus Adiutrix sp.]
MGWGLLGLESATLTLARMMRAGRLPHALLLTGPRGGGKNSLARALAAALNCAGPDQDGGPCGQCPSCLKVAKDIHPDLITLAPVGKKRQIKIDDVRALRGQMAFRPFEGRVKIFIIREADRLNPDSGNALLKTLEEPPPDSVLILTTSSASEVMTTILSRCLRLRLPPLPHQAVLAALAEKRGLSGPQARLLASSSAGALGAALALDPEETWRKWAGLNAVLGAPAGPARLEVAWRWVKDMVSASEPAAEDEGAAERFYETLNLMRLWWRETARLSAAGPESLEGPPPAPAQFLWAERLSPPGLARSLAALNKLTDSLSRFVKPELAFENYWLSVFALWR